MNTPPADDLPPRYRVERVVGEGGFGVVLRAHDQELDRPVAIKRLRDLGAEARARFYREAKRTARLRHPHVIEVLDFGSDASGAPFLVYEWVDGRDLSAGRASVEELRGWGAAIAEALHEAHRAGVVHRDVKPANVLLREDGHVLLADLGIARVAGGSTVHTAEGLLLGTPAFMAPELLRGEPASPASDQWAWAASLVRIGGGEAPWGSDEVPAILEAARGEPGFAAEVPGLPEGLTAALSRALAPAPEDRYPDLEAFARVLQQGGDIGPTRSSSAPTRVLPGYAAGAGPVTPAPGQRAGHAPPARAALAPSVALVVAVAAGAWIWSSRRPPRPPPAPQEAPPARPDAARASASAALTEAADRLRGGLAAQLANAALFDRELPEVERRMSAEASTFPLQFQRWLLRAREWLEALPGDWPTWTPSGPDPAGYAELHRRVHAPLSYWTATLQLLRRRRSPLHHLLADGEEEASSRAALRRAREVDAASCGALVEFRDNLPPPHGAARVELELLLVASSTARRWPAGRPPPWIQGRSKHLELAATELARATAEEPLADLGRAAMVLMLRLESHEPVREAAWVELAGQLGRTLRWQRPSRTDRLSFASDLIRVFVRGSLLLGRPPTPREASARDAALTALREAPADQVGEVRWVLDTLRTWVLSMHRKSSRREHLDAEALLQSFEVLRRELGGPP